MPATAGQCFTGAPQQGCKGWLAGQSWLRRGSCNYIVANRVVNRSRQNTILHSTGRRRALFVRAAGAIKEGELVSSEEEFLTKVTQHQGPVVVDWMAKWCRKCIYLKPKLEKLLHEEFPGLDLVFIDVNAIPGSLVYGHGVRKMPTITIHKDGTKVREHIAAEAGAKAITNIKSMISDYLELNPEEKKLLTHK